jgi:hypothetical protein
MRHPDVLNKLIDPDNGVTYEVVAYRSLTKGELLMAVRYYLASVKKRPKRGAVVRIISVIS